MALPKKTEDNIDRFSRALHPKKVMLEAVGDLSGVEVMYNSVLVAIHIKPEMTSGGIIKPLETKKEDVFQNKVGLVLKVGLNAFLDDGVNQFFGQRAEVGDWVVFHIGDARSLIINDVPCRLIEDSNIRMKVKDPNVVTQ